MKRIRRILLILLIVIPIIIRADEIKKTYSDAVMHTNNYMNRFDTRDRYLINNSNIYGFDSSGKVVRNSDFTNAGLLSSYEFNASIIGNKSYLSGAKEYWNQTSNGSEMFYIDLTLRSKSPLSDSGVRVTSFVKPDTVVTGSGTFSNPWEFLESYIVNIKKNRNDSGLSVNATPATVESGAKSTVTIKDTAGIEYVGEDDCNLEYVSSNSKYERVYQTQALHSDLDCVAVFKERKIAVNYNCGNNANNAPADHIIVYGTSYSIKNKSCSKAGYTQTGWRSSDGTIWSDSPLVSGTFTYENGEIFPIFVS